MAQWLVKNEFERDMGRSRRCQYYLEATEENLEQPRTFDLRNKVCTGISGTQNRNYTRSQVFLGNIYNIIIYVTAVPS